MSRTAIASIDVREYINNRGFAFKILREMGSFSTMDLWVKF